MKLCIVYPPYWHTENQPGIKSVDDNYGVYPNLSLAYVAAIAEKAGHKVRFIDANALKLTKEETLKEVKKFNPGALLFTITTYLIHQNLSWIRFLKNKTDLPVISGGVHFSIYPKETFVHKEIDYAIMGEAENVLPYLLDALEKGKELSKVNSIIYRAENNIIKVNGKPTITEDLDKVPFPARHLLPNHLYYEFISKRKNFTGLIASRGCQFKCIYCEQGGLKFRPRSPKNIIEEFKECYEEYKVREIDIFDSSFTIQRKRVIEICKLLQKEKLDLQWAVRSRVDCVDKIMLKEMKKAGCDRIYYGIESGVPRILKKLGKSINLSTIQRVITETKKAEIKTFGYFMIGSPGESIKTINKTIKFAKSLDLDYAQFSKVSPLPGTPLYDKLLLPTLKVDYWKEFVLGNIPSSPLPRPQCDLTEREIQKYIRRAYKKFYFRPKYIIKRMIGLNSFDEFKRYLKAGLSFI